MDLPTTLSSKKRYLLDQILTLLKPIPGVQAVALGGSQARGLAWPNPDLDKGSYQPEFRV